MAAGPDAAPAGQGKRPFFRSVGALVASRVFVALSQILVLPVLARYLAVEDFAVMALAMAVVLFAGTLSDGGFGRSLIRQAIYDPDEWATVFWVLAGVGAGLSLAVVGIAPVWSWLFAEPRLTPVLIVLSSIPLMQAVSATPNAEVERREAYGALAALQAGAAAAGMAVAVVLALAGAGVWALVGQQVALAAVRTIGVVGLSRFRPRFVFHRDRLGGHVRFARDTVSTSLIAVLRNQTTTVAIGKLLGTNALGIFAMHQRFARLPQYGLAGPVSAVVFVRMARAQDDAARLVRIYLSATRLLASALLPALGVAIAAGPVLFTVLLSEKWAGVAPFFALAIPGVALEAVTVTCLVCLFRAVGRTDLQVRLMIEGTLLRIPLVVAAALISLEAVAAALTLWAVLLIPRGWALAARIVPLSGTAAAAAVLPGAAAAVLAASAYHVVTTAADLPPVTALFAAAGCAVSSYGVLAVADRRRLRDAIGVFG